MKLCWIHPTTKTPDLAGLWSRLEEIVSPSLRPDTEIEHRFLKKSGNFVRSLYAEHLNSVHMIEAALEAESDGFDGIFLGCWNDPLWEAREVLSVPVASVGEQSMLASLSMAKRFAVVTVSRKTTVAIENDLMAYGLQNRSILRPVRAIEPQSDVELLLGAVDDPAVDFIPRFEDVANGCIRDGAEIIIVGCAYFGPLLRAAGYTEIPETGAPVLDSTTVALKYLEAMTDISLQLGLVKSTHLTLRSPEKGALLRVRKSLLLETD